MSQFLLPSAARAQALRAAMAASWHSSLTHTLQALQPLEWPIELPPRWNPEALDVGAYFDLHMHALQSGADEVDAVRETALQWLAKRFSDPQAVTASAAGSHALRIRCLDEPDCSAEETARYRRWLDTDVMQPLHLESPDAPLRQAANAVLRQAWACLGAVAPELRDEIAIISPEVLLARSGNPSGASFGGASSFCLWGCVALNAETLLDVWDGFTSLVHESAHGLLFAHARHQPLVLNALDERYESPLRADPRPMDGVFHAAFVSAREVWALRRALAHVQPLPGDITDPGRLRLRQRLQASEDAFHACHDQLSRRGQLSELGTAILQECRDQVDADAASAVEMASP